MRIGDVKVGAELAALDNPNPGQYSRKVLPRKVRVLEIVTEEKRRYVGGYSFHSTKVNVRRVRVEALGQPIDDYWARDIGKAKEGAIIVVDTRNLIGEWTPEIEGHVTEATRVQNERNATEDAVEARLTALGLDHTSASVKVYNGKIDVDLRVGGPDVERLLSAAEKVA